MNVSMYILERYNSVLEGEAWKIFALGLDRKEDLCLLKKFFKNPKDFYGCCSALTLPQASPKDISKVSAGALPQGNGS